MKLNPLYSYEFNKILNEGFDEDEQIKNFASLLSDKDRFLALLQGIELSLPSLEKYLGYKLPEQIDTYVVRAEKFKSFSMPITIEYSMFPEEMIIHLLKEIIFSTFTLRFPDFKSRDEFVLPFLAFLIKKELIPNVYEKHLNVLMENSKKEHKDFSLKEFDGETVLVDFVQNYYDVNPLF